MLPVVSAQYALCLYRIDIKSAFLHEPYTDAVLLYVQLFRSFDGRELHNCTPDKVLNNIYMALTMHHALTWTD